MWLFRLMESIRYLLFFPYPAKVLYV
jgi:hypothetical protein